MAGDRGRRGGWRGGTPRGGRVAGSQQAVCQHFQRHGTCKFGDGCRYSHNVVRSSSSMPTAPGADALARASPRQASDGRLREWKRLLAQGTQFARPSPDVISQLFQLGKELMDSDIGTAQEIIKLFADQSGTGLSFMKDVIERHIPAIQPSLGRTEELWTTEVKPLLQFLTHHRVVDSAVLEQEMATLFNYLYGIGGARMQLLFEYVTRMVQSLPANGSSLSRIAVVELSLAVLAKILDCNTTAMVNQNISVWATCFEEVTKSPYEPEEEFARLQALKYLDYVRLRINVGAGISGPEHRAASGPPVVREQFLLRRDLPGNLSANGPRHNNDNAEISKIQILPTYDEIMSQRAEYLPTTDPSQWHFKGIAGRVDREFRLLREDTVGQLRDTVKDTLDTIRAQQPGVVPRSKNSARTYGYDYPVPQNLAMERDFGLSLLIRCNQLTALRSMTADNRRNWWTQSKRLQPGSLVCLLDATGLVQFFVVSEDTMRTADDKPPRRKKRDDDGERPDIKKLPTLAENPDFLFVRLNLAEPTEHNVEQALRWYQNMGPPSRKYLVEFPGVLLASFKDTLAALQEMYKKPDLPFAELIAPATIAASPPELEPPRYAKIPGFQFDLSCITDDNTPLKISPHSPPNAEAIASKSTLDPTQSIAVTNTLSRGFSLIQGPPGTGKSYTGEKIIKILLANKEETDIGPILCVCYTNHALDQLLEHLLDDPAKIKVIRIGSRSKSERLQDLNIRTVAKAYARTRTEKAELYRAERGTDEAIQDLEFEFHQLSISNTWGSVKALLESQNQEHHDELFGAMEGGFKIVNHSPQKSLGRWLSGGRRVNPPVPPRPIVALEHARLKAMTCDERRSLYSYWLERIRDLIIEKIWPLYQDYILAKERRDRVRGDLDLRCMEEADIIGVTTTGLARNLSVLRKLKSKVMLCEEAGEVLEAHILTALLPSVEHVIMIGDHLQLRPQIQNYDLQSTNPRGAQYSLDTSLFERLVQPPGIGRSGIPFSILETQRRMHPSVSDLIRSTLYPSLKDGGKVTSYPEISGMKKRLFWLHHENLEAGAASLDPHNTSHTNDFEVEMATALVSHLVRQGEYSKSDIAVITPYLGQLQRLRHRMASMFEICLNERDLEEVQTLEPDTYIEAPQTRPAKATLLESIRLATVDNFQGEEAKVIVISLVRSNPQRNVGFLRTSNRINVLLSRAKHGMYILGNTTTYQSVPMWASVIGRLQAAGNVGTHLDLQCARHPNTPIAVSEPDHFLQLSPESGCSLPCEKRLLCGHACPGRCHSDMLHNAVKCQMDCPRPKKGCDHACPLRCGDRCHEKCQKKLENIDLVLQCGHRVSSARCWEVQDPNSLVCKALVTRKVPGCGHKVTEKCHVDVSSPIYICPSVCGHLQACGHSCSRKCQVCNKRVNGRITMAGHGPCPVVCGRDYSTCRHSCKEACHGVVPCKPCSSPCEVRCSHSKCSRLCSEPCPPCAEQSCASCCVHAQCTMPCAAPCNWVPCSKRCQKLLACGHQCPSLCGEACPSASYCQQCGSDEIKSTCVDLLELSDYQHVNLDKDPCIFANCGHFLTVTSMDGQMGMTSHYDLDTNGLPTAVRGASVPFSTGSDAVKVCPLCRGSLRNISRYGRIVRRGILDESTRKFISWSNSEYSKLAGQLATEQGKLQEPNQHQTPRSDTSEMPAAMQQPREKNLHHLEQLIVDHGRYKDMIKVWRAIDCFKEKVQREQQPFQRVANLVQHVNRQSRAGLEFKFEESVIQAKGCLLAESLLLECEVAVFLDFVSFLSRTRWCLTAQAMTNLPLDFSIHERVCLALIDAAATAMYPKEETKGHLFAAQMHAFAAKIREFEVVGDPWLETTDDALEAKKEEEILLRKESAMSHLQQAQALIDKCPSVSGLKEELSRATTIVQGGYHGVSAEELRAIYQAMSTEFSGTGHWYTCRRGHPFTVGECGMPMEMARCPDCGAPVGGTDHRPTEGVRHADEIERLATSVEGLGF